MYVNKCVKCGREFETKNPKRVICPDCLYPDKKMIISSVSPQDGETSASTQPTGEANQPLRGYSTEDKPQFYSSYSSGGNDNQRYNRPQQRQYNNQGGYRRDNNRDNRGGYNRNYNQAGITKDRSKAATIVITAEDLITDALSKTDLITTGAL